MRHGGFLKMRHTVARATAAAALVVSLLLLQAGAALAAPGDVDRTFGRHGAADVVGDPAAVSLAGEDMVVGANDEIYVLVSSIDPCPRGSCRGQFFVERFGPDGALDTSFGSGGRSVPLEFSPSGG